MLRILGRFSVLFFSFVVISACSKNNESSEKSQRSGPQITAELVAEEISTEVTKHKLYHYPEITLLIAVNDAQDTSRKIKKAGGKIVYDPNREVGHSIPFLVVTLPSELVLDQTFVKSLNLKAAQIDHPALKQIEPKSMGSFGDQPISVPVGDIGIPDLRNRRPGLGLGENTLIAVIDTGVDASHPIFQKRVTYWNDLSQETLTSLKETEVTDGKVDHKGGKMVLPSALSGNAKVFVALIKEESMRAQLDDADKNSGEKGLDLNRNGKTDDEFLIVVGDSQGEKLAFVDTNLTGQFEESEEGILDFNIARNRETGFTSDGMIHFPLRGKTVAYPLLLEVDEEGTPKSLQIGVDFNNHGTHVAGIAAGNGEQIKGAAPEAKIMSLKVCTGITCTTAAILRALVDAFYNPYKLIPDVVNISLGSQEAYQQDVFNFLMRDLSAKFGTVFFISASNSGVGYRSINSIGSFGPVVSVGAHVSKDSLIKLYNLAPGVEAPEHSLLFFSSVGPSYTGQLRPNIVAPGAALSSTSLINGGSAMYNGTSMSSPLTAGAAAALISLLKPTDVYKRFNEVRETKIKQVLSTDHFEESESLMFFPLAIRTSLEETAQRMPFYTMAQQGHGLISINNAFDRVQTLTEMALNKSVRLFDFEINGSGKANRLYDRSVNLSPVKIVNLAQEFDGELTEEARLHLQNRSLRVQLDRVEVQSNDGSVEVLTTDFPYQLAQGRGDGSPRTSAEIVLSNTYKKFFYSVRKLEAMEAGKTYVANYNVYDGNQRIFSILDVVHVPIHLTDDVKKLYLPGIEPSTISRPAVFGKASVKIAANAFHRYPIAVTKRDSQLLVEVGLSPNEFGNLYVQVYSPDGEEIFFEQLNSDKEHPSETRLAKATIDIEEPGVYEVTLAAGNRNWMGPTKYDLLVTASRFKADKEELKVDLKEFESGSDSVKFFDSTFLVSSLEAEVSEVTRYTTVEKIKVQPQRWTFAAVQLSDDLKTVTDWEVSLDLDEKTEKAYSGRLDNALYTKNEDGSFSVAYTAEASSSGNFDKTFKSIDGTKPLYLALETFDVVPEESGLKGALKTVNVNIYFPSLEAPFETELATTSANGFFAMELTATKTETVLPPQKWEGTIEVKTNDSRISTIMSFEVEL